MHYRFNASLIDQPAEFQNAALIPDPGLSPVDIQQAKKFYPRAASADLPALRPYEAQRIRVGPGEQLDFVITPEISRQYTIQTFGRMDTVMVLFEEIDGRSRYLQGDDDSGWDRNAKIKQRLFNPPEILPAIAPLLCPGAGEGALMMY